MATESAANSDSTLMNSHPPSSPDFTISPRPSTMCVWGVIGYAQITCGRASATASATAREPSICLSMNGLAIHPRVGFACRSDVHVGDPLRELVADRRDHRVDADE